MRATDQPRKAARKKATPQELQVPPGKVMAELEQHILVDRFRLVFRLARSRGSHFFDLPDTATRDAFWKGAHELGPLVLRCGDRSIRLLPVLDVTDDIIQAAIRIMDQQCCRL